MHVLYMHACFIHACVIHAYSLSKVFVVLQFIVPQVTNNFLYAFKSKIFFLSHLQDLNDNSPVFTRSVYNFVIKENIAVGSTVGR